MCNWTWIAYSKVILVGGFSPPRPEKYEFVNWDDESNPIFLGTCQKWQPNHQPESYFTAMNAWNLSQAFWILEPVIHRNLLRPHPWRPHADNLMSGVCLKIASTTYINISKKNTNFSAHDIYIYMCIYIYICIYIPGSSKWPFQPWIQGHLTPKKGHLATSNGSLWRTWYIYIYVYIYIGLSH